MATITVLRLEDANGRGCFHACGMQDFTTAAVKAGLMTEEEDDHTHWHSPEKGCPGPYNDPTLMDALGGSKGFVRRFQNGTFRYGFHDADLARQWFPPCMAPVLNEGKQTLTVWEVPEEAVAIGDRQCVFDKRQAKLVERLPVEALYEPSRSFT